MNLNYELFPAIEPYDKGYLQVSSKHKIYYEQVGNPKGSPILFIHGGPGSGISADNRRYFDPNYYRVILFDQRGAGLSQPSAELQENTTWDLVADIEKIRQHLGLQTWSVFGGSWGSTLGLTYAITHTAAVKALILRGIFLCRPSELQWFYQQGASQIFPDLWETYKNYIPTEERHDFIAAYYKRLTDKNFDTRVVAAKIWSQWEAGTSRLKINQQAVQSFEDTKHALEFARIECHYFINKAFFPTDNYLLENISKIRHIPGWIVQGRYDIVCPAISAWQLHQAWPEADFTWAEDAGHSISENSIRHGVIKATEAVRILGL